MLPASTLVTPSREAGPAPCSASSCARTPTKGPPKLPQHGGHLVSKDFVSRLAPPESPRSAASDAASDNSLSFWSAHPAVPSLACALSLAASCDVDAPTNELPLLSPVACPDSGARAARGRDVASPAREESALKMRSLSSSSSEFSYAGSEEMYELDWRRALDEQGRSPQVNARRYSRGEQATWPALGQLDRFDGFGTGPSQTHGPVSPPPIQERGGSQVGEAEELMEDSARRTHRALLALSSGLDSDNLSNKRRQRKPVKVAEEFFPAFTWANFHLNQIKEKEQSKKGFFSAFVKAVIVCKESAQKLDSNLSVSLSETQVGEFTSMHLGRQLVQEVMQGVPEAWREPLRSWRGALSELMNLYCLYVFAELSGLYCRGASAGLAGVGLRFVRCLLVGLVAPVMLPPALRLGHECWRDLRRAFKPQYPDDINGGTDARESLRRALRTLKKWVCWLALLIWRTLGAGNGSGRASAALRVAVPAGQAPAHHAVVQMLEVCARTLAKLQQDARNFLARISPGTILHNQALSRRETLLAEAIMESEHFFYTRGAHLQTRWTSLMLREAKIDKKRNQLKSRMEELERREEQLRDMEEAVVQPVSDPRTPQGACSQSVGLENPVYDSPFDLNCRASLEMPQQLSTMQNRPSEHSRSAWEEDQACTRRAAENFLRAVESSRNKPNQDLVSPSVESVGRCDPSLEATRAWVYETGHPKNSTQTSLETDKFLEGSRAYAQSNLPLGTGASAEQVKIEPKHRGGKTMTRLRRLVTASFLTKKKSSAAPLPQ